MKRINVSLLAISFLAVLSSCGGGHQIEDKVWFGKGDLITLNDGIFKDINSSREKTYELNEDGTEIIIDDDTLVIVKVDDKTLKLKKKGDSDIETYRIAQESDFLFGRWRGENLDGEDVFLKFYVSWGGDDRLSLTIDDEYVIESEKFKIDGDIIKSGGQKLEFEMDGQDDLILRYKDKEIELMRD